MLGGNGILLDNHVGRFVADVEAIYSYEGTREMNILIVGKGDHRSQRFRLGEDPFWVCTRRRNYEKHPENCGGSHLRPASRRWCGKPPAFVVAEIDVKDLEGYEMNYLKPAQKTIADHGGKYLAGGFNKTLSLAGTEPPNRVVLLQFANMDAVEDWQKEGEADLENDVGEKYAKFRVYAVEGLSP